MKTFEWNKQYLMQIHANDTPVCFRVSYLEDLYYFNFIVFYDMPVNNRRT